MSFVKVMWMEHSVPDGDGDVETRGPSMAQISDAIVRMDGHFTSYVMLFPTDEPEEIYLVIAGGTQGYYFVSHWDGVESVALELVNPNVTSDEFVDVELGQISKRRASQLVDRETAQRVAMIFAETGELAPDMMWKKV
jgi:hypothetical protein